MECAWVWTFLADSKDLLAQAIGRWWLIWEFGDDTMSDKEACIQAYLKHNAHIRATIPPERLLEWEAKDGWEPLCRYFRVVLSLLWEFWLGSTALDWFL